MQADLGKLILRVTLGLLIFLHGISKLMHGADSVTRSLVAAGLPTVLTYGVYVGEVVAPLLLILGIWSRAAAGVVAINMLFALALMHMGQLFSLNGSGGWSLELQGMYLGTAVAISLLGAGRYSVAGNGGRWN